jgi:hypothetical protein
MLRRTRSGINGWAAGAALWLAGGGLVGCLGGSGGDDDELTNGEAYEALSQALVSGEGEALVGESISISTDFTIADGLEAAAENLHDFLVSQSDCWVVTRDGLTVSIDYGVLSEACVFNGKVYGGRSAVTLEAIDAEGAELTHAWTDFTDGVVTVTGAAAVSWDFADPERRVVDDLTWTGRNGTVSASGERSQTLIDEEAGLAGGIVVDGRRDWTFEGETWTLTIEGVQMRGIDPIPQAGVYRLSSPDGHELTLSFGRLDAATIRATLRAGAQEWRFDVTATGVTEA